MLNSNCLNHDLWDSRIAPTFFSLFLDSYLLILSFILPPFIFYPSTLCLLSIRLLSPKLHKPQAPYT
jgi:hypothetical protein